MNDQNSSSHNVEKTQYHIFCPPMSEKSRASCWAQSTQSIYDKDPHWWNPLSHRPLGHTSDLHLWAEKLTTAGTAASALNTQIKAKRPPASPCVLTKHKDTWILISNHWRHKTDSLTLTHLNKSCNSCKACFFWEIQVSLTFSFCSFNICSSLLMGTSSFTLWLVCDRVKT